VLNASLGASARVRVSSPVTTECQIDDDVLRLELGHITLAIPEVRVRRAPSSRIDLARNLLLASESGVSDFVGDRGIVSRPEPYADESACSLDSVPSSTDSVEVGSEGRNIGLRLDNASRVAILARGADLVALRASL